MARGRQPGQIILYNPEIHCGAKVNKRNPEKLAKAVQRATCELNALKPTADEYDLKKGRYERIIRVANERLAKLQKQPDDRPCCNKKGFGTDHFGDGHCHFHCQCHGRVGYHNVTGNLYRQIKHRKLQDALSLVENQTLDIMDLVPEVNTLRALAVVFFEDIERRKNLTTKDIETAANLIDKIGRQVERINAIQLKAGVVTHAAVVLLTSEMAKEMVIVALDMEDQPFDSRVFIESVKDRWNGLSIDAHATALPPPAHSREAT